MGAIAREERVVSETFSALLNHLFNTAYPPGRGPHTSAELVAGLANQGIQISAPYVSQLRSGVRTRPSWPTIEGIAKFFRVSPAYFTDDYYRQLVDEDLSLLAAMRDE
jgi:hypothetical protein